MLSQTLLCFHVQYESNTVLKPCTALPCNQTRQKLSMTDFWFPPQSKLPGAIEHCCIFQYKVTHFSRTLFSSSFSKIKHWFWTLSYFPIHGKTLISNIALICTKIATRHCPWTEPCFPEQLRLKILLSNPALCSQTLLYALKAWSIYWTFVCLLSLKIKVRQCPWNTSLRSPTNTIKHCSRTTPCFLLHSKSNLLLNTALRSPISKLMQTPLSNNSPFPPFN